MLETVFLIVAVSALSLLLIYEIVFVLFFKDADNGKAKQSQTGRVKEMEEVVQVQPRPLGYAEPPTRKFEQCPTPVLGLSTDSNTLSLGDSELNVNVKGNFIEKDVKKAPIIVVSSPK